MGVAAAIESQTTGVAKVHLFEEFKLNDSVAVVRLSMSRPEPRADSHQL